MPLVAALTAGNYPATVRRVDPAQVSRLAGKLGRLGVILGAASLVLPFAGVALFMTWNIPVALIACFAAGGVLAIAMPILGGVGLLMNREAESPKSAAPAIALVYGFFLILGYVFAVAWFYSLGHMH